MLSPANNRTDFKKGASVNIDHKSAFGPKQPGWENLSPYNAKIEGHSNTLKKSARDTVPRPRVNNFDY
jgi:hypothetical protein